VTVKCTLCDSFMTLVTIRTIRAKCGDFKREMPVVTPADDKKRANYRPFFLRPGWAKRLREPELPSGFSVFFGFVTAGFAAVGFLA